MSGVIAFPTTPGRFAITTKSRGTPLRIESRHHSLGRALGAMRAIRQRGRPDELEYVQLYDTADAEPLGATSSEHMATPLLWLMGRRGALDGYNWLMLNEPGRLRPDVAIGLGGAGPT
jgi:hypothetical protein